MSSVAGDIKYLICHMTSQNNMIEGSSNFMSGSFSWFVTTSPRYCTSKNIMILLCHLSSKTTRLEGQVSIIIGAPQDKCKVQSLVVLGTEVVETYWF